MYFNQRKKQEMFLETACVVGVVLVFFAFVIGMFAHKLLWIDLAIIALAIGLIGAVMAFVSHRLYNKRKGKNK